MTTENLPALSTNLLPAAQEFNMFQTIARSAKLSGLYGGDENKIFMVLLAARELGIPPMLALNGGIWNIQGKIEISARLMNSMIRRSGHTMKITSNANECTIQGKRADTGEEHTETFTMQMADKAGLSGGNVWKKYPEDMLYNRCMSRLARRLFPDVIGTAYVEGEIKEAKEVEKQELQQAQYEDVTPQQNDNHNASPEKTDLPPKPPLINQDQLNALLELMPKASEKWRKNLYAHLKTKNVFCEQEIPLHMYNGIITSIELNIENKDKINV